MKPLTSVLHIIQHYLTSRASFTSILTSSIHQIVVEMVFKNLPLVAYRRCKNISHMLVRAQLTETPDSSNSRATPVPFGAIAGIVPLVPTLNMATIIILFIPQVKRTTSNLI